MRSPGTSRCVYGDKYLACEITVCSRGSAHPSSSECVFFASVGMGGVRKWLASALFAALLHFCTVRCLTFLSTPWPCTYNFRHSKGGSCGLPRLAHISRPVCTSCSVTPREMSHTQALLQGEDTCGTLVAHGKELGCTEAFRFSTEVVRFLVVGVRTRSTGRHALSRRTYLYASYVRFWDCVWWATVRRVACGRGVSTKRYRSITSK